MGIIYKNSISYSGSGGSWTGLPSGGTAGQALVKKSNTDQDVEWSDVDGLPSGGTQGQVLTKQSSTDGDADWEDIDALPSGGTTGQVLAKKSNTDGDVEWITSESGHTIKNNGTAVADESSLNFTDFDISDDSTNEETDIKAHRLTSSEMADICSPLPGAPYRQIEYSTTEQVIGKWIDGKPVYQKTIFGKTPSTTKQSKVLGTIDNFNILVSLFGQYHHSGGYWMSFSDYTSTNDSVYSYVRDNGNVEVYAAGSTQARLNQDVFVTIQYTKTTD